MDLLVVVIVIVAVMLPFALHSRHDADLGIVAHAGNTGPDLPAADATPDSLIDEDALRARRESEWRYWYQLGNS